MFLFYLRPLAFYNFVLWNFHIYNVVGNNLGLQLNDLRKMSVREGFVCGETLSVQILFTLNVGEEDM